MYKSFEVNEYLVKAKVRSLALDEMAALLFRLGGLNRLLARMTSDATLPTSKRSHTPATHSPP